MPVLRRGHFLSKSMIDVPLLWSTYRYLFMNTFIEEKSNQNTKEINLIFEWD